MRPSAEFITSSEFNKTRADACKIFQAGIAAADPYKAVKRCLSVRNNQIELALDLHDASKKRVGTWSKIHLLAFGKAACAMAQAAQETIPEKLLAGKGIAVTNYENVTSVSNFNVIGANHPIPDTAGLKGATMVAQIAEKAGKNDLVLVLISGGGSALIPCPVQPISLEDKKTTTVLLLACGATINQINSVRKHLSQLKGGGLARKAVPANLHALILSDVLNDDLSTIASGPTVADGSTYQDACTVLESAKIWGNIPDNVRTHLEKGKRGEIQWQPQHLEDGRDELLVIARPIRVVKFPDRLPVGIDLERPAVVRLGDQQVAVGQHLTGPATLVIERTFLGAVESPDSLTGG